MWHGLFLQRRRTTRLREYIDQLGKILGRADRRQAFATCVTGLLSDCERKSVEPIAAMACADPSKCRAMTERLLNFVTESRWEDRPVRMSAARHALRAMTARESIAAWIFDDTGFIKQGNRSPGVQRQYTESAGKTTNCQLGVSLTLTAWTRAR